MATKIQNLKPVYAFGPGDFIQDFLEDLGWNAARLAEETDLPPKQIENLLQNQSSVTLDVATRLSNVFGNSTAFWLQAQENFNDNKR